MQKELCVIVIATAICLTQAAPARDDNGAKGSSKKIERIFAGTDMDPNLSARTQLDYAPKRLSLFSGEPDTEPVEHTNALLKEPRDYTSCPSPQQNGDQPSSTWRKPLGWTLLGVGGAAMVTGLVLYLQAWDLGQDPVSPAEKPSMDEKIDNYRTAGLALEIGGALLGVIGTSFFIWENHVTVTPRVMVSSRQACLSIGGVF